MTAGELALVLVCVLAFGAFVVMLFTAQRLLRAATALEQSTQDLRGETIALVRELRTTVAAAGTEVARVDALLDAAETISGRVDAASRLGYVAFRTPVIRFMAVWTGLGRMVLRLVGLSGRRSRAGRPARAGQGPVV